MADGFTLEIDADLARKIERTARESGLSVGDTALMLLERQVFDYDDYVRLNGDPREVSDKPYDGPTRPWEKVKAELTAKHPALFGAED